MGRLRRHIAWVVSGWLCCQLTLLTAAPLSMFTNAPQAADPITCVCVHGENARCPMHHPAKPTPDCQCRNATNPDSAAIVTLLGPIAVLADAPAHETTLAITQLPNHPITSFVSLATPPDGPPPRA